MEAGRADTAAAIGKAAPTIERPGASVASATDREQRHAHRPAQPESIGPTVTGYSPGGWGDFFLAAAAATAALSGLIFVGLSVNIATVLDIDKRVGSNFLTGRAIEGWSRWSRCSPCWPSASSR